MTNYYAFCIRTVRVLLQGNGMQANRIVRSWKKMVYLRLTHGSRIFSHCFGFDYGAVCVIIS